MGAHGARLFAVAFVVVVVFDVVVVTVDKIHLDAHFCVFLCSCGRALCRFDDSMLSLAADSFGCCFFHRLA